MNLWQAWNLAKTWSTRPSEIYGIKDAVAAYYFDQAVTLFGQSLENAIHNATKDAKNDNEAERKANLVMDRWVRQKENAGPQRYKDPARKG